MKNLVSNLIPRIKQYSEDLDKKEFFVDIPWVIIDEQQNQQKYIFKRNGDLIMSLNGQVTVGKWEYLSSARSLLIDRIHDKILLNQNFIASGVMILKKDGIKEDNLILANESLIPDLNVYEYLKKLYYKKQNIVAIKLNTGEYLELNDFNGWFDNNKVTIEGALVPDGFVFLADSKKKIEIKDSKVLKVLVKKNYNTNRGEITVEQSEFRNPVKGDYVFQNGTEAPNGKYRLGFLHSILVENGIIIKS